MMVTLMGQQMVAQAERTGMTRLQRAPRRLCQGRRPGHRQLQSKWEVEQAAGAEHARLAPRQDRLPRGPATVARSHPRSGPQVAGLSVGQAARTEEISPCGAVRMARSRWTARMRNTVRRSADAQTRSCCRHNWHRRQTTSRIAWKLIWSM